jgi:hypothetical protein
MPSPMVDRASERGVDAQRVNSASSPVAIDLLYGPDPSIHMLGLPKSYPHLGRWLLVTIITGAVAAFLLVALTGG